MIDETKQDLAAEYVLGSLDVRDAGAFEAELQADAELRAFVDELRESTAALAHAAPPVPLPPALREKVLASVRGEAVAATAPFARPQPQASAGFGFMPWAIAAGLAITAAALWMERTQLQKELISARGEALELRNRDEFAQIKIATLTAQNDAFAKGSAIVVWDAEKQQGVVKLAGIPRPPEGKDYQLWVLDPKSPAPVSAGVVPIGTDGLARVSFTPEQKIRSADNKFAISVERTGGAPAPAGPIVFVGN